MEAKTGLRIEWTLAALFLIWLAGCSSASSAHMAPMQVSSGTAKQGPCIYGSSARNCHTLHLSLTNPTKNQYFSVDTVLSATWRAEMSDGTTLDVSSIRKEGAEGDWGTGLRIPPATEFQLIALVETDQSAHVVKLVWHSPDPSVPWSAMSSVPDY
ncbi:MAG: hypothetical protein LC623_02745 [Halobacteriales archaeon]|nr:hypothetical protein [Halobacteriales archaeon]